MSKTYEELESSNIFLEAENEILKAKIESLKIEIAAVHEAYAEYEPIGFLDSQFDND